ncbi:MAG: DUF3563 family protein [Casimicrobiaceae bacterium]
MRTATPVDSWSAYFALLTEALSVSSQRLERPHATPRADAFRSVPKRTLMERLDHWFADHRSRARERYLAESKDLCELETRMRELDQRF